MWGGYLDSPDGLPGSVENFTATDRVSLGLLDYVGYVSVKEFV